MYRFNSSHYEERHLEMKKNDQDAPKKLTQRLGGSGKTPANDPAAKKEPLRFQFGHDMNEADVDQLLDIIFGKMSRDASGGKESSEKK